MNTSRRFSFAELRFTDIKLYNSGLIKKSSESVQFVAKKGRLLFLPVYSEKICPPTADEFRNPTFLSKNKLEKRF